MTKNIIRIATRKSPLALWQANYIKQAIFDLNRDIRVEIIGMVTEGDKILSNSLIKEGGKGLFIKELQNALFEQRADIAVHSMKDMPAHPTLGLHLLTICAREDPRDAFVSKQYPTLDSLPSGSIVGTSSQRRMALLQTLRPDLLIHPLRGNVGTRLEKLNQGHYDAIILAAAGLKRLGLSDRICNYLDKKEWIPAVGQGAIGIECRSEDIEHLSWLLPLDDSETRCCVSAERAFNQTLNGGCGLPIGAHAVCRGEELQIDGFVFENNQSYKASLRGDVKAPEALGKKLAEMIKKQN